MRNCVTLIMQKKIIIFHIDLSFAGDNWRKTVTVKIDGEIFYRRDHLESCVFTCLATELKCGDVYIKDSENYSDYRVFLLFYFSICVFLGNLLNLGIIKK